MNSSSAGLSFHGFLQAMKPVFFADETGARLLTKYSRAR
jgi:hypothetical protein